MATVLVWITLIFFIASVLQSHYSTPVRDSLFNDFSGYVPYSLTSMTLHHLNLSHNSLSGPVGNVTVILSHAHKDLYREPNYAQQLAWWNSSGGDPCEESWKGISCNGSSVIFIHMNGLELNGRFRDQLFKVVHVKQLVEFLVLDESDKLFELGFFKQIDSGVKACAIMHDADRVIVGRKNSTSELIKQKLVFAGSEEGKLLALRQSFAESLNPPILVFIKSKERAKEPYKELAFDNIRVNFIHSDLSQTQREDAVNNFRPGKTWVLIASTDVIACVTALEKFSCKGISCPANLSPTHMDLSNNNFTDNLPTSFEQQQQQEEDGGAGGNEGNEGAGGNKGNEGAGGNEGEEGAGGDEGEEGAGGNEGNEGAGGNEGEEEAGGAEGGDEGEEGAGGDEGEDGAGGEEGEEGAGGDEDGNGDEGKKEEIDNSWVHEHDSNIKRDTRYESKSVLYMKWLRKKRR